MRLIDLIRVLWAWRRFIVLSAAGCCAVAMAVAYALPTMYEARARVTLDIAGSDPVSGQSVDSVYAMAYATSQIEMIGDYGVAGRAVDAAGLTNSPQIATQYRASVPDQSIDFRRWLAQQIIANTSAGLLPDSNILEIRFTSTSPEAARTIADLLRAGYIDQTIAMKRNEAQRAGAWFDQQADELRERLETAQAELVEFQRENDIVLTASNLSVGEMRMQALMGTSPAEIMPRGSAPVVAPSAAALAEIEARIEAASERLGPNHPAMRQLNEQRDALQAAVAEERAAMSASAGGRAPPAAQVRAQQSRVLANSDVTDEARRMAAGVAMLQEQYREAATRAADLALQAEAIETGVTPIGEVALPLEPWFPNWPQIISLSLGFGLAAGILTALLLELLSLPVRSMHTLEMTGVEVLNARSIPAPELERQNRLARWIVSRIARLRRATARQI